VSRGSAARATATSQGERTAKPAKGDVPAVGPARDDRSAGDPFEALGDANRRSILTMLGDGGRSVGQIADALPISRPAVSRHLKVLKDAGLVQEEAAGTRRIYRLQEQGIEAVRGYLEQLWGDAAVRFRLTARNTKRDS
jgi:DNA-binding transcriptional ArsR family regulator